MKNKGFARGAGMILIMMFGIMLFGVWLACDLAVSTFYSLEYDECVEVYFPEYVHNFADFGCFADRTVEGIEGINGVQKAVWGNPDIRIRVWMDKDAISQEELQTHLDNICERQLEDDELWDE